MSGGIEPPATGHRVRAALHKKSTAEGGIIGIIALAFGLVTPPYGLCLLIDVAIARTTVAAVIKDVAMILAPMLIALLLVILFPEVVLFIPRWFMPKFV